MSLPNTPSNSSCLEEEERLKDYEVKERIGHGRFGEVYKVRRLSKGDELCWKVVSYRGLKEKEKRQLVAEVNVMRQLRHDNIVTYYDRIIKKADQKLYIVMEYCNAGDLATCISDAKRHYGGCSEEVIRSVGVQLAAALDYCHSGLQHDRSVLHRDLKPQNVFLSVGVDSRLRAKLGDFGLSRHLDSGEFAQTCVGTPYYWSPELMKEGQRAYNYKSDIWSYGCILYEMATGSTPFSHAQSLPELKEAIKRGPDFSCHNKISKPLSDLLKRLLHPDPGQRPSARQLIQESEEVPSSFLGGASCTNDIYHIEKTEKGLKATTEVCNDYRHRRGDHKPIHHRTYPTHEKRTSYETSSRRHSRYASMPSPTTTSTTTSSSSPTAYAGGLSAIQEAPDENDDPPPNRFSATSARHTTTHYHQPSTYHSYSNMSSYVNHPPPPPPPQYPPPDTMPSSHRQFHRRSLSPRFQQGSSTAGHTAGHATAPVPRRAAAEGSSAVWRSKSPANTAAAAAAYPAAVGSRHQPPPSQSWTGALRQQAGVMPRYNSAGGNQCQYGGRRWTEAEMYGLVDRQPAPQQ
eukprot:GHVS01075010.1.p1 GENE.GHVS01075010.1~~GHVS01075010.1.p1  ORF type:complete len:581 (+),score=137.33 GHVS01075010.1:26-1744(+)